MKKIRMLYGKEGMELSVPSHTEIIGSKNITSIADCAKAIQEALDNPIDSASLKELLQVRNPSTIATTFFRYR